MSLYLLYLFVYNCLGRNPSTHHELQDTICAALLAAVSASFRPTQQPFLFPCGVPIPQHFGRRAVQHSRSNAYSKKSAAPPTQGSLGRRTAPEPETTLTSAPCCVKERFGSTAPPYFGNLEIWKGGLDVRDKCKPTPLRGNRGC